VAALALGWGLAYGVRPVLAYGLAHMGVLLLLWRYPSLSLRHARVQRHMPDAACEDERVRVEFEVRNEGRLRMFNPVVEDSFAPDKVRQRRAHLFPALASRRRRRASYMGRCSSKRGRYAIGPATLTARCPLGLFSAQRTLTDAAQLTVYPSVATLPVQPARGASLAPLFGGHSTRFAGDGDLPLSIRDYRPGDPPRQIHWPTSARRGRMAVLERERHVAQRLTVVMDTSLDSLRGLGRQSTLEVSVRVVAAVAARALDEGYRVGLRGCGQLDLPSAGGRAQLARILDALALVRPVAEVPLSRVVADAAPDIAAGEGALLIVADAERDLDPLIDVVGELLARRCLVSAVVLDPAGFPRLHASSSRPPSLDAVASRLVGEGVVVYALRPGDPLPVALSVPYSGRQQLRLTPGDL